MLKYYLTALESMLQLPSDVNVKCYAEFAQFDENLREDERLVRMKTPVRTRRPVLRCG
jgi:hypothetical protein